MDTDLLTRIYNDQLKTLSAQAEDPCRLDNPDISVTKNSMICGSSVTMDLCVDENQKITKIGFETESCALTKSVLAVLAVAAIGKTASDIKAAYDAVVNMFEKEGPSPSGDWKLLEILEPVREYPARHDTIYLPFMAVEKAFLQLGSEE